jgi:hypothetical protein
VRLGVVRGAALGAGSELIPNRPGAEHDRGRTLAGLTTAPTEPGPAMSTVRPWLSEQIQRRIDRLKTFGTANWVLRVCKEELNALPLQANANQLDQWALRADGTVLCLDCDSVSHTFETVCNPVVRYAVLAEAARRYPELRELEPPRPAGVERCERCDGSGWTDAARSSCPTCNGLGWHMRRRPVEEWLARVGQGDRLELRAEDGPERLIAGRVAGLYVARGDGLELWSAPVGPHGRRQLGEHLMRFAIAYGCPPAYQRPVTAAWEPNPTSTADPFESVDHSLRFHGSGAGGSYEVDIARQPDGRYRVAVTLNHDWDPLGGAFITTQVTEIDEAEAHARVESEMRSSGRWNPFPAVVPRASAPFRET